MTRAGNEAWPEGSFVQQLPDADRTALLDAGTPLRFEDDQILLVQGDAGDFLYVLTSGLVKVIVETVNGAQTTLAIRSRATSWASSPCSTTSRARRRPARQARSPP